MYKAKLVFLPLVIVFLCSCSQFADGNRISAPSYDNKSIPPMRTPPGKVISFEALYPIPQRNYPSPVKPVDISPPSTYANKDIGRGWFSW